jgi:predicted heme/steroid binding protein
MRIIKIVGMIAASLLLMGITTLMVMRMVGGNKNRVAVDMNLPPMTIEELKKHDGSDPTKSIYLAYEGNIYDVTAGKEYYQVGGVYHFLAGKDSTDDLNFAGGAIVKSKYKIVARLVK